MDAPTTLPKGEWLRETNLMKLKRTPFRFSLNDKSDIAIFRESGKPTVDFYLRKNRWKVRGEKKSRYGTSDEFITWYKAFRGM